jgi:hypothetical protein
MLSVYPVATPKSHAITNIPMSLSTFPTSNDTILPTYPSTKLIQVCDCRPCQTFGTPEPHKSHDQIITGLPMAIARHACQTPTRCDAAHPAPHPLRLNAGPRGKRKSTFCRSDVEMLGSHWLVACFPSVLAEVQRVGMTCCLLSLDIDYCSCGC